MVDRHQHSAVELENYSNSAVLSRVEKKLLSSEEENNFEDSAVDSLIESNYFERSNYSVVRDEIASGAIA